MLTRFVTRVFCAAVTLPGTAGGSLWPVRQRPNRRAGRAEGSSVTAVRFRHGFRNVVICAGDLGRGMIHRAARGGAHRLMDLACGWIDPRLNNAA